MSSPRFKGRLSGRLALVAGGTALMLNSVTMSAVAAGAGVAAKDKPHYGGHGHAVIFSTRQAWKGRVHSGQAAGAAGAGLLTYGGGVDGIGVTTGPPRVYVVFWGSQWGTPATASDGTLSLGGDAQGVAPRVQALLKGWGLRETWSGVMTQYCEGVTTGATTCPSNAPHVGFPSGGALAGVWADEAAAVPGQATAHQIAAEAVSAAPHFGQTSAGANRNAQHVIVSPAGAHPDGFNTALYSTGASGSVSFTWTVNPASGSCGPVGRHVGRHRQLRDAAGAQRIVEGLARRLRQDPHRHPGADRDAAEGIGILLALVQPQGVRGRDRDHQAHRDGERIPAHVVPPGRQRDHRQLSLRAGFGNA